MLIFVMGSAIVTIVRFADTIKVICLTFVIIQLKNTMRVMENVKEVRNGIRRGSSIVLTVTDIGKRREYNVYQEERV